MSASQRTKGASFEREIVNLLRDQLGVPVERNLAQSRDGGGDIELAPYLLECKRRARIGGVYDWMRQAEAAAGHDLTPVVVMRADREEPLVCMQISDWMRLVREDCAAECLARAPKRP